MKDFRDLFRFWHERRHVLLGIWGIRIVAIWNSLP